MKKIYELKIEGTDVPVVQTTYKSYADLYISAYEKIYPEAPAMELRTFESPGIINQEMSEEELKSLLAGLKKRS